MSACILKAERKWEDEINEQFTPKFQNRRIMSARVSDNVWQWEDNVPMYSLPKLRNEQTAYHCSLSKISMYLSGI